MSKKYHFHGRLKEVRDALGYNQREMAEVLGVTQSTYAYMESKTKGSLTLQHLAEMVHVLNVNPLFIIRGDYPMFLNEENDLEEENMNKTDQSIDEEQIINTNEEELIDRLEKLEAFIKDKFGNFTG